jgi:hypothetical protein
VLYDINSKSSLFNAQYAEDAVPIDLKHACKGAHCILVNGAGQDGKADSIPTLGNVMLFKEKNQVHGKEITKHASKDTIIKILIRD